METESKQPLSDIASKEDITQLVDTFYQRVNDDALLSPAFNIATELDWQSHLPRMVEFWHTIIFRQPGYKGNPYKTHSGLHQRMPLTPDHFEHWVALFADTVDMLFAGERADFAKKSATQMGRGLSHHLFTGKELFNPLL